jgi:hypothetical protein
VAKKNLFTLSLWLSMDGYNFQPPIRPYRSESVNGADGQSLWLDSSSCHSISLCFRGSFDLSSHELTFSPAGYN